MKRVWIVAAVLFALSASAAKEARPGWLGFAFTRHGKADEQWLVVRAVLPNGPAATSGLRENDVITAIDGKPIRFPDSLALLEFLGAVKPKQRVTFTALRDQKKSERVVVAVVMTDEQFERWKSGREMARRERAAAVPRSR